MRNAEHSRSLLGLVGFSAAVAIAAWYGSRKSRSGNSHQWYRKLDKPSFTPPDQVFPIVWTGIYGLIAWSGWRVWSAPPSSARSRALRLWATQLASNARWTKLFFEKHRPDLSLRDSIGLEAAILGYIVQAGKVDAAAALAFVPYAAWVGFATVLNAEIARRNPDASKLLTA